MQRHGRTDELRRGALGLTLCALLLFTCAPHADAARVGVDARRQDDAAEEQGERGARESQREGAARGRFAWLRALNLTPQQLAQIREIRRQAEREGRAVTRRLAEARRALDEAIYAEASDERLIEQRARELSAAQGEATRLRALTELKVRRVLTDEQLKTFRGLRRDAQTRQSLRRNRRDARQERRRQRRNAQDSLNQP